MAAATAESRSPRTIFDRTGRARRLASAALVARALARSLLHHPIRLIAAMAGGIGGVVLTTAVLMIAVPVLYSTRIPPMEGLKPDVVAVAANATVGISNQLAAATVRESGATSSSKLTMASTTVRAGSDLTQVAVLGVELLTLSAMLDVHTLSAQTGLAPLAPGEAYLPRAWADERGFSVGDRLEVTTLTGLTNWRVAALVDAAVANRGAAIMVPASDMAAAFDRAGTSDVLLLRGADTAQVREKAAQVIGGAGRASSPDHIFDSYNRIFRTPLTLVTINALLAILTGSVVLFLTWRLALADSRPVLSRLRIVGVSTGGLVFGSGLVLLPIMVSTYIIGAIAGCLLGRGLSSFRDQITSFTGQALDTGMTLPLPLLGAFAATVVMFGLSWLSGLWQLRRISAIDAITGRDATVASAGWAYRLLLVGLLALVTAAVIATVSTGLVRASAALPNVLALVVLSTVLPVVAGTVLRKVTSGPTGLFIGRQLEMSWRRNAALGITFAVALFTSLTVVGGSSSIRHEIGASMARVTSADLFVAAAPLGESMAAEQLPVSLREDIRRLPGVISVDSFALSYPVIDGGRNLLEEIGGDAAGQTAPRIVDGPAEVLDGSRTVFEYLSGDNIAVSTGFAEIHDLQIGSPLELPTADGTSTGNVVALVDDSVSDGGMVLVGHDMYEKVAGEGLYSIGVKLAPDVDRAAMHEQLKQMVASAYPRADVLTLDEYRGGVTSILGRLMSSFVVFAWVMFGVAAVVGIATLASSMAERSRGLALARLVGGRAPQVRRLVAIEAVIIVAITWMLALPAALIGIPAMLGGQSLVSGLQPPPTIPVTMMAVSLPVSILSVCIALVIARRSCAEQSIAEILADE